MVLSQGTSLRVSTISFRALIYYRCKQKVIAPLAPEEEAEHTLSRAQIGRRKLVVD